MISESVHLRTAATQFAVPTIDSVTCAEIVWLYGRWIWFTHINLISVSQHSPTFTLFYTIAKFIAYDID